MIAVQFLMTHISDYKY